MLRQLHNHIFAVKLREVFVQSPLVLVYQTLGQVDHQGIKQALQGSVTQQLPAAGVRVDICHMKNTMAAAAGDDTLARLFNNSNVLVGFKLPEYMQQQQQQAPPAANDLQPQQQQAGEQLAAAAAAASSSRVRLDMSPSAVVGGLLEKQMPGPHLPQPTLRALVELGVALPSQQPLVLVGAFYKRGATPLAYLKQWIKLDAGQVYGELIGTLESPIQNLLAFEGTAEELLATFDAAAGSDLASVLDFKAAQQPEDANTSSQQQ
uniref:Uncharacterized protein n=1 Tax=Tetradesmus obliquus TaxID=3088 RepID=A0A383W0U5_TETOB|eukprot:jgi/Sobl393_1/510/SZX71297.1